MTWAYATLLLLVAAPVVLWPLVSRREPRTEPELRPDPRIAAEADELDGQ